MTSRETENRARREAPTLVSLLESLSVAQEAVVDTKAAWDELLQLADDRRVGAKEASQMLGVLGPNLYDELKSQEARELFGGPVPVRQHLAGGGKLYSARDIEALAAKRRPHGRRSKRKQRPSVT